MNLNGAEYFCVRNAQGDIIGLIDGDGVRVVSYAYDSWGKLISIKDKDGKDITTDTNHVGYKNPYRYRGYRYDNETGLYYLQSRYYNPEWGRFLNADGLVGVTGGLLSHNMFAYCMNNPINMSDPSGKFPWLILVPVVAFLATWATAVLSSPDLHTDIAAISMEIEEGDKIALGIDIASAVIPALPAGGGRISKAIKKSGVVDKAIQATSKLTKKGILKNAQLPTAGKIRYVPPKNWTSSQPLPKLNGGFIDKFGNVWTKGPSRTAGQAFEWDVQLSKTGQSQLGQFSRDGSHLNVSLDGRITHK
ncbi:polymorphic toxin type 17 domain-containing protein [Desnuesiella massiliensis]|uniref:polymorphic toxin type 17 domain-containing protein n=1 Tax=Desnuesiella massiliensis TaxID=1650662 RepID=UPI0006E14339|nr:polymorphic toxin type 17 domain-containing protein [Desnuesiella massiliensis]